jgi:hypothetical protein
MFEPQRLPMRAEEFEIATGGSNKQLSPYLQRKATLGLSVLAIAILTTWVGIAPRIVPIRSYDRGAFVTVAARLLAGDTLYSGVYDNKDPLFYYFLAGQVSLGPWAEVVAEALLIAIAVAAAYFMAVKLASRWTAVSISFIAIPILLTGGFYYPGFSELPGIALVLVSISASAWGRPVLAGLSIGLLLFLKLIFVPIALVGAGCFLLAHRRFSDIATIALGASISAGVVAGVLVVRGELLPFIDNIRLNVAYSQGSLIGSKEGLAALVEHIRRVEASRVFREVVPILVAMFLVVVATLRKHDRSRTELAIAWACVLTFFSSLAALSITGLWDQHGQILYIPATIILLALAPLLDSAAKIPRPMLMLGLVILMGALMAGPFAWRDYEAAIESFPMSYIALSEPSPETLRLLKIGRSGTYARFGQNDDQAHAIGLRDWKLACPRFHQFPFYADALLDKAFECGSAAQTLVVAASLKPDPRWPLWNKFVARVEHLIERFYSCDADSGLRVCRSQVAN